jgi:hypothetical protein
MPPPDAKATYATLHATVVAINPDQVRVRPEGVCCWQGARIAGLRGRAGPRWPAVWRNSLCLSRCLNPGLTPTPPPHPPTSNLNRTPPKTMYYLANPESGKKVVEQEGRFWSEGEGK